MKASPPPKKCPSVGTVEARKGKGDFVHTGAQVASTTRDTTCLGLVLNFGLWLLQDRQNSAQAIAAMGQS